jgi:hypothetical protein
MILSQDPDGSRICLKLIQYEFDRGGFPRAVFPDEPHDASFWKCYIYVFQLKPVKPF